ncbi:Uncharacterized MFS-type transporter C19orf28 [Harpegnathos saltator]|uniref:Uncharacterized MFS-type transporter C19orf28 n=1 Tax=Harpegnathos saltator TaxID=610380 RepID=E2B4Y4_HARSA|nr:Uncharacterized MFS-type transporter C19orf28 [Harpegnathos saltator]
MDSTSEQTPLVEGRITMPTKLAYALGHIFNDLAAAMWFSYTLIYLQRVVLLQPIIAGGLLLLGQVVDAVMTPVFGFVVDRYCKKKTWHILGSVMVTLTFPVIFGGFASSFSSLVMVLYSAQVSAAVIVFVVTWIVLPTNDDSMVQLDQRDYYKFRNIVLVLTALGLTATAFFHMLLKAHLLERPTIRRKVDIDGAEPHQPPHRVVSNEWTRITILLRVAMLYVASRLFITLATVYLPLYIEETEVGGKRALATVPLVSYVSSFVAALLLKYINRCCGTKICYFLGAVIGIVAAAVTEFVDTGTTAVYVVAVLIGAGSSITMVTALSVTAELIGSRTERSALVYSIVTFLDKIVTGLVVILIERWRCNDKEFCPTYNRDTLSIVCASSMLLGLITLLSVSRCLT